jgi:hypothetical protein
MSLVLFPVALQPACLAAAAPAFNEQAGFVALVAIGFGTLPGVPVS